MNCLRSIKSQLTDPNEYLSSWVFSNESAGFICKFAGVTCWHDDENRVLSIKLSGFDLGGQFPVAIKNCTDLTGLELSRNNFSGPLPTNVGSLIPSVTTLDLSENSFSGEIPVSVSNITFLNALMLQSNQFTGTLPAELVRLGRLSKFSVANNRLSGPIPVFNDTILKVGPGDFAGNAGLCGKPLDACEGANSSRVKVVVIAAVGGLVAAALVVGVVLFFYFRRLALVRKKLQDDPEDNRWARILKQQKGVKVNQKKITSFGYMLLGLGRLFIRHHRGTKPKNKVRFGFGSYQLPEQILYMYVELLIRKPPKFRLLNPN